jgi:hypothetical protein
MAAPDRRGARLVLVLSATALLAFLSGAFFVINWCATESYISHRSTGGGPGPPRFCLSASRLAVDILVLFGFAIGGLVSNVGFSCYHLFFASDDQYRDVFGYDDEDAGKAYAAGGGKSY